MRMIMAMAMVNIAVVVLMPVVPKLCFVEQKEEQQTEQQRR